MGTLVGWFVHLVVQLVERQKNVRGLWDQLSAVVPKSFVIFFLITALGWIVATVWSIDVRASLGVLKAWFLEPVLFCIVLLLELKTTSDRSRLEFAMLVALMWVSLAGLFQLVLFRSTVEDGRLSSVFAPVANYFAMFAAPLLVYAMGMAIVERRRLTLPFIVIGIVAIVLSISYGGILAVGAGLLVLIVAGLAGRQRKRAFVGAIVVLVLFIAVQIPTRHFQEKLNFTTRSSGLVRTQIWRTALEIGRQHPVLGIGPGTFEKAYRIVAPTLYHPPLEWLVAKPHNLYINLWVETGILGVIGTLGMFFMAFRYAFKRGELAAVPAAAAIAMLVQGILDTPLFKNDLAVIGFVMLALMLWFARRTETEG
jgi:O-antigen ligase